MAAAIPPTTAPSPAVTTAVPTPSVAASATLAAVDAANAFLDALTSDQRSQLPFFAFDSPLRPNWSNLPPGIDSRSSATAFALATSTPCRPS